MMWQATLRDLQWRRRRFLIAITGTALVFAMSLLMSGLSASFTLETDRTSKAIGARRLGRARKAHPAHSPRSAPSRDRCRARCGRRRGHRGQPIIYLHQTIGDEPKDINLFGVVPGGAGRAHGVEGTRSRRDRARRSPTPLGSRRRRRRADGRTRLRGRRRHEAHDAQRRHRRPCSSRSTMRRPCSAATRSPAPSSRPARPTAPIDGLRVMTRRRSPHRSPPSAEERVAVDQLREGAAVDRRRLHHRLDRLPLGDGAHARLRRVQGDRNLERRARRAASRCRP